jgi:ATP synthase protein I
MTGGRVASWQVDEEAGAPAALMADEGGGRGFLSPRSLRYLQENVRRAGPAAAAGYTLIGAILLLGGVGYLLDGWLETSPWMLVGGLLLGVVVGLYEVAKLIWRK